ncbi:tryptophanyl-tRNA synthetase [Ignicoccus islandicus DSM 13165]|uniref:Tryptophan--tRNA ligase n=1 Tax=Ignicoccus islandicus DSM 13165 TaxID=940295 RepID=A0A0U2VB14_9CREN|nr:tryptophan--tRNA ligase [Ignicoccus islandicus]ALU11330.1 tryptophanyl-tRNA synthetase [Ignicoccus islandicus DSM 13165]
MPNANALEKITDYDRLVEIFGVSKISKELLKELPSTHKLLEIGYIFAHRDFDKLIAQWKKGEKFAILTGRGPSNALHLGHLLIFEFVKWLQDTFKVPVFIPLSDDEKYVFRKVNTLKDSLYYAYDNALDIAALGFDERDTNFFISSKLLDVYQLAITLSRHVTLNEVKAVFGFSDSDNPGKYFYSCIQAAHILYPTWKKGFRSLVPIAIDQDPYIRLSRDIAERIKLPKPAAIHSKYLPGLTGEPMSASKPETAIFIDDDPYQIKSKIWRALTGGQPTIKEQREKGGNPDKCIVFKWLETFVLTPHEALEWKEKCRSGQILCGECKRKLFEGLARKLYEHHKSKLKVISKAEKYFIHEVDWGMIEKIEEKEKALIERYEESAKDLNLSL